MSLPCVVIYVTLQLYVSTTPKKMILYLLHLIVISSIDYLGADVVKRESK